MNNQKIEFLSKSKAEVLMITNDTHELLTVGKTSDYAVIHSENLRVLFANVLFNELRYPQNRELKERDKYKFDLHFGLKFYEYINESIGASMREVSNPEFWIYLSILVIPDIVSFRHGDNNHIRSYQQNSRVYLSTLWWYIHLSWQGSYEDTCNILKDNSTDEIMNLVERTGKNGYRIDLYREIMKRYSMIDSDSKLRGDKKSIFRRIMTMNTMLIKTTEPSLLKNKEVEYVERIFDRLGLTIQNGVYKLEV